MKDSLRVFVVVCTLAISVVVATPGRAQMTEVKEKPPMYTYVAYWTIPRAQWGEMVKQNAANRTGMEKAIASGAIVGYGNDTNLIHEADGGTHDTWWSSMSMAGLLGVLEESYKSGTATSPVLMTATKHWDTLYVSRYYNWHSGSWKGLYTRGASYKLKEDAPTDAVGLLSKNLFVPLLEKMLADGTIHEYEIDTESIHTEAPGTFNVFFIAANADALDKFNEAVAGLSKTNPLGGPAIGSMVDFSTHRDDLAHTDATYK